MSGAHRRVLRPDGYIDMNPVIGGNGWNNVSAMTLGDFNGDGKTDIMAVDGVDEPAVFGG